MASLQEELNEITVGKMKSAVKKLGGTGGILGKLRNTKVNEDKQNLMVDERWSGDIVLKGYDHVQLCSYLESPTCGQTSLSLSGNSLSKEVCLSLASSLQRNTSVTSLMLWSCNLSQIELEIFCKAIETRGNMKHIGLWGNTKLGDASATVMAHLIQSQPSITSIDLGQCSIGDRGALMLASSVGHSQSLEKLELRYNNISDAGAHALASAITQSNASLDLRSNPIKLKGKLALEQARIKMIRQDRQRFLRYDRDP